MRQGMVPLLSGNPRIIGDGVVDELVEVHVLYYPRDLAYES